MTFSRTPDNLNKPSPIVSGDKLKKSTIAGVLFGAMAATGISIPATAALPAPATAVPQSAHQSVGSFNQLGALREETDRSSTTKLPAQPTQSVTLGSVRIGLPDAAQLGSAEPNEGMQVFRHRDNTSNVIVNPTQGGVQFAVAIAGPKSPQTYAFKVSAPAGATMRLLENGGVAIERGTDVIATVAKPWARDAAGRSIPTSFRLAGKNLVQEVNHRSTNITYPVLADPSIKSCDWGTSWCVKFSKSETKSISKKFVAGTTSVAVALAICSKIPHPAIGVICVGVVTFYATAMKKLFKDAAREGKCAELHFTKLNPTLWKWKKIKC